MSKIDNDFDDSLPTSTLFNTFTNTICDLNESQLHIELSKRGLITTGKLNELKIRLIQYLNAESLPSDFTAFKEHNFSPILKHNKMDNMENKKPYFKPGNFSGQISESITSFLKKYNRAAAINGWNDDEKAQYLAAYLQGPALIFFENIEYNNNNIPAWPTLEKLFTTEYEPTTQKDMLRSILERRTQLDDELTVTYINDAESLCRRIDPLMSQDEIVRNIRKGLKPEIARYIGILENNSVSQLKENIRKYDTVEFLINGKTSLSPTQINNQIINEQINALTYEHNKQVNNLTQNNEQLKKQLYNLKNQQNFSPYNNNQYNNPPKFNRNYFPNTQKHNEPPQIISYPYKQPYNQKHQNYNRSQYPTHRPHPNDNYYNRSKQKTQNYSTLPRCDKCNMNNHTNETCFFKDIKKICQLCNKTGHEALNCSKFINNSKN